MIKGLLDEIISHGDRGAVVPFSRVNDLKKDMFDLKNGEFHTDWINRMVNHITADENKFIPPDVGFEPRSLICIVMSDSKVILSFNDRGKSIECVVPPNYVGFDTRNARALKYINDYLAPLGYSAAIAPTLPQKMLAVHCGLCLYGRSNICYNDDFGSYTQIMTYISDLPCEDAAWFPLRRMEICENCTACVAACPTGVIDPNRRLIDSDRCITYFNEFPGEFPEWLPQDAHNSITGCSKCQDCCPANKMNENNIKTGPVFTAEETAELLKNNGSEPYSDSLRAKLEATDITEFKKPDILPRNLRALLKNQS
jgi:epoxyqueuosine reductase